MTSKDQAWEEFSASFAAARLMSFLLSEIRDLHDDYADDLRERLRWPYDDAYSRWESDGENPDNDPSTTIYTLSGEEWETSLSEVAALWHQLFPSGISTDLWYTANGCALVGLVSALDAYVRSLDLFDKVSGLCGSIARTLGTSWEPDLEQSVREAVETRNIIVHRRGEIDHKYLKRRASQVFVLGERRPITDRLLSQWAGALWHTGQALLEHTRSA